MAEPGNTGLEADIGVTLGKLQRQMALAEARMIRAAQRGENAFRKANPRIVKSFDDIDAATARIGKGSNGATNGLRQISLQLSQVGQQGAATGDYLKALAIQLPDLALALGPVGIIAGAIAGSLLTMGSGFIGASDDAKELEEALESLRSLSKELGESLDLIGEDVSDLSKKYGEATVRVLKFAVAQSELRLGQVNDRLKEQVSILDGVITQFITSAEEGFVFEERLRRINEAFGVAGDTAVELEAQLQALFVADTFEGQQAALENLVALLADVGVNLKDIPEDVRIAIDEFITLSNETDAARKLAEDLAAATAEIAPSIAPGVTQAIALKTELAAVLALQNRVNQQSSLVYSGRGEDPRKFEAGGSSSDYESELGYQTPEQIIAKYTPKSTSGRTGGSRASTRAKKEVEGVTEALKDFERQSQSASNEFSDFFSSIIRDSDNAGDAISRLADRLIDELLDQALKPVSDAFGSLFSGLFSGGSSSPAAGAVSAAVPSFDGGGFTGFGARSGGLDGKGGFPAMLHPNETVIDHSRGQSMGGGSVIVHQTFNMAANGDESVKRILQAQMPAIEQRTKVAVYDAQRRDPSRWGR